MQTLKYIGACVAALLAVGAVCSLAELVLLNAMHMTNSAPPIKLVLSDLVLALFFATICVTLLISAAKDNPPKADKTAVKEVIANESEVRKR